VMLTAHGRAARLVADFTKDVAETKATRAAGQVAARTIPCSSRSNRSNETCGGRGRRGNGVGMRDSLARMTPPLIALGRRTACRNSVLATQLANADAFWGSPVSGKISGMKPVTLSSAANREFSSSVGCSTSTARGSHVSTAQTASALRP
jgi:hypothetical protein